MFDPQKFYLTDDPDLRVIGAPSTLATWRSERRGPPFVKLGAKIAYKGSDLLAWIAERTVRPEEKAAA